VGVLNAAVWFGSTIFFTFVAAPVLSSAEVAKLLGTSHTPFFAGAIAQLIRDREAGVQLMCSVVALLHLLGERLYFGRAPGGLRVGLLAGLTILALMASLWVDPKLSRLHTTRNAVNASAETREAASRSFDAWYGVWQGINVFTIVGLGIYVCRVGQREE
jgi:hypothetical protein